MSLPARRTFRSHPEHGLDVPKRRDAEPSLRRRGPQTAGVAARREHPARWESGATGPVMAERPGQPVFASVVAGRPPGETTDDDQGCARTS